MGDTTISWTDKTWNCIAGCSRVSEGCRNCYAERTALRFAGRGKPYEGLVTSRLRVIDDDEQYVEAHWTGKVKFIAERLDEPLRWRKPCRVFVNSMSDVFHEALTNEQIAAIFGVMAAAPRHQFQVLTKRSRRMREWFAWIAARRTPLITIPYSPRLVARCEATRMLEEAGLTRSLGTEPQPRQWPLPNVWIGVSVENQKAADERIPDLLQTPTRIRFLSCEPLLERVDLLHVHTGEYNSIGADRFVNALDGIDHPNIDWVIAGCESGPRARPCDYRWLRSLRDQCDLAGTKFFLKQANGQLEHDDDLRGPGGGLPKRGPRFITGGGDGSKRKSGNVFERPYLDGRQHLQFPA